MSRSHTPPVVSNTRLQLPGGAETLLLEDAYAHRQVVAAIDRLFTSWGYLPIQTPMVDFFDGYRQLLDDEDARRVYRLVDRDGELLMLRGDATLFMAKQIGVALDAMQLPLRVCYYDSILRHQEGGDLSHSEFYQVGAELVGVEGDDGDLEALALLCQLLDELRLPGAVVHLGSRVLLDAFAATEAEADVLRHVVLSRDLHRLVEVIPTAHEAAVRLFAYVGEAASFVEDVQQLTAGQPEPAAAELRRMAGIVATLLSIGAADRIRVDLSEIGSRSYHTGVAFSAYLPGLGSAVAAGGRYDRLLAAFGDGAPAAGFSLLLRKVESAMEDRGGFRPSAARERVEGGDFAERYRRAEQLRADGHVAVLR